MPTVIGLVISIIGFFMSIVSGMTIQGEMSRNRYAYSSPLSDHETAMAACIIIGFILIIIGICVIIFSIASQRSKENLMRIQETDTEGIRKNTCDKCGLTLSESTKRCPQCGNIIKE